MMLTSIGIHRKEKEKQKLVSCKNIYIYSAYNMFYQLVGHTTYHRTTSHNA